MFISEQYGWCYNLSGEFFDAMLNIGFGHYYSDFSIRDVDLMLMSL